jgi:hypothetical protein
MSEPALCGAGFVVLPGTWKVRARWFTVLILGFKSESQPYNLRHCVV